MIRSPERQISSSCDSRSTNGINGHIVMNLILSFRIIIHKIRSKIIDKQNHSIIFGKSVSFIPTSFIFSTILSNFMKLWLLNSLVFLIRTSDIRREFRRWIRFVFVGLDHPQGDIFVDSKSFVSSAIALNRNSFRLSFDFVGFVLRMEMDTSLWMRLDWVTMDPRDEASLLDCRSSSFCRIQSSPSCNWFDRSLCRIFRSQFWLNSSIFRGHFVG